jgi:plasmid stabilization system protein ParE
MATILVYPRAGLEIRQAELIWRAYHPERSTLFADEYNHALDKLQVTPRIGPPYPDLPQSRHILLKGCQHYLHYDYDLGKDEVRITGIENIRRGRKVGLHRR